MTAPKQVTLVMTEEQAKVLRTALDVYWRIGLGDLGEVASLIARQHAPMPLRQWTMVRESLEAIKADVFGLAPNATHGIFSEEKVPAGAREVYDIVQVLRRALAKARWEEEEAARPPEERGGWKMDADFHDYLPAHPEWPPVEVRVVTLPAD